MSQLTDEAITTADVVEPPQPRGRRRVVGISYLATGLLCIIGFGLGTGSSSDAHLRLTESDASISLPNLTLPATITSIVIGVLIGALGVVELVRGIPARMSRWASALVVLLGILSFLTWSCTGDRAPTLDLTGLLTNTAFLAVPLVLGAMAGIVSERSGVINIAIEGQMLAGAFTGAMVGTMAGGLYAGVFGAVVIGALVGALLATFAMRFLVNQVVLGVVINTLMLGLTGYLTQSVMQSDFEKYNDPGVFTPVDIPGLSEIPILGPLLFSQNVLVYATYVIVAAVHIGLFRTRWGLRTRAIGEHPRAADTLGINVNRLRFRNVMLAGAIAGLAGAVVSIGSVGAFGPNMTSGRGYIALAVVIFGSWRPIRAVWAALLFAFCSALKDTLPLLGTPVTVPSQFVEMLPYVATIVVVAGVIGRVRAPAADGVPYTKS